VRQIVLDTETTGLDPAEGHRIIEIGCVELLNRRLTGSTYQQYVNPDREIDDAAIEVHGITNHILVDKPRFPDIAKDFFDFIEGAELIIHNAPFDVGFIDNELKLMRDSNGATEFAPAVEGICTVVDTLALARSLNPGQKNDLDSLCKRYGVDNSQRTLHGALRDAEILADVYLVMSGGQAGLFDESRAVAKAAMENIKIRRLDPNRPPLPVVRASAEEITAHQIWIEDIDQTSGGRCLWKALDSQES
jgi:DNA polymerase-3 subunit epsilon